MVTDQLRGNGFAVFNLVSRVALLLARAIGPATTS
jgi:hypothetical protein